MGGFNTSILNRRVKDQHLANSERRTRRYLWLAILPLWPVTLFFTTILATLAINPLLFQPYLTTKQHFPNMTNGVRLPFSPLSPFFGMNTPQG